jgi:hypothetical protein
LECLPNQRNYNCSVKEINTVINILKIYFQNGREAKRGKLLPIAVLHTSMTLRFTTAHMEQEQRNLWHPMWGKNT